MPIRGQPSIGRTKQNVWPALAAKTTNPDPNFRGMLGISGLAFRSLMHSAVCALFRIQNWDKMRACIQLHRVSFLLLERSESPQFLLLPLRGHLGIPLQRHTKNRLERACGARAHIARI